MYIFWRNLSFLIRWIARGLWWIWQACLPLPLALCFAIFSSNWFTIRSHRRACVEICYFQDSIYWLKAAMQLCFYLFSIERLSSISYGAPPADTPSRSFVWSRVTGIHATFFYKGIIKKVSSFGFIWKTWFD